MRKRSATTSSTFLGPVGDATSRSAWTRVKPLAASHCSISLGAGVGGQLDREGDDEARLVAAAPLAAVRSISSA